MANYLPKGKLTVTIVEANLTNDTEVMGKMDPYVVATWGEGKNDTYKTKVLDDAGKKPVWTKDNQFEIDVSDVLKSIKFEVLEKDNFSSDHVGSFKTDLTALCFNDGVDQWFDLYIDSKNKLGGQLHIKTSYASVVPKELTQAEAMDTNVHEMDFIYL